jgi:hypothetical protein
VTWEDMERVREVCSSEGFRKGLSAEEHLNRGLPLYWHQKVTTTAQRPGPLTAGRKQQGGSWGSSRVGLAGSPRARQFWKRD